MSAGIATVGMVGASSIVSKPAVFYFFEKHTDVELFSDDVFPKPFLCSSNSPLYEVKVLPSALKFARFPSSPLPVRLVCDVPFFNSFAEDLTTLCSESTRDEAPHCIKGKLEDREPWQRFLN